jgi:hypothetical protein
MTDQIAQIPYTIASKPQATINPNVVIESSIVTGASERGPDPGGMWRGYAKNRPSTQRRISRNEPSFRRFQRILQQDTCALAFPASNPEIAAPPHLESEQQCPCV